MNHSKKPASLRSFFEPHGIAVVGASEGDERAGSRALDILLRFNYPGEVYPISRSKEVLQGLKCYSSVADVPDPVDLAVICVGTQHVAEALLECGKRGIPAAVIFAAGFSGEDETTQKYLAALIAAQRESGVRVIGPNTIGIRSVEQQTWVTFAHDIESGVTPGEVAVIAQSGGLGVFYGSAYLRSRGVGTRYLIDTGNELDVDAAEVLEYLADDPKISCFALILEGSRDGRRLMRAVERAKSFGKPVVFLKSGQSASASSQVSSHTGAIASDARLFETAMTAAGAIVVRNETEFVDTLDVLDAKRVPRGRRLGVVTPSGGFGILAIDASEEFGMTLPHPVDLPTVEEAEALASGTLTNPFDYTSLSAARVDTLPTAVGWMVRQSNVDALVIWTAYARMLKEQCDQFETIIVDLLSKTEKPVYVCGMTSPEFKARLRELGVILFEEPSRLIRVLSLVSPAAESAPLTPDRHDSPEESEPARVVVGVDAQSLLPGIEHVETVEVEDASAAVRLCEEWGEAIFKVESPLVAHKSEAGLVSDFVGAQDAVATFDDLLESRARNGAGETPVTAQRREVGVELAIGGYVDPSFGPAVMVAMGGIYVEIMKDAAVALAPLELTAAKRLILSLRGASLMTGARGRTTNDVDAAARALVELSKFMAEHQSDWDSVEINPLIVREAGRGAVAVDTLFVPATQRKEL
ncbi:MAG TPA: acetate--CoA ligase family protein [Acidimicrobiales bacterium]